MSAPHRSVRWALVAAVALASATALFLGASIADARDVDRAPPRRGGVPRRDDPVVGVDLTDEDRLAFFALTDEEAARLRRSVEGLWTALRIEAGGPRYDLRQGDLDIRLEDRPEGEHEVESGTVVRIALPSLA